MREQDGGVEVTSVGGGGKSVADLLGLAISGEMRAGTAYGVLAVWFSHVGPAADLWIRLRDDEDGHRRQLEQVRAALRPEQLAAPADDGLLERARAGARASLVAVLGEIETLEDAFALAHDMEHHEANRVFAALAVHAVSHGDRRAFYLAALREHVGRLAVFTQRYGGAAWRRGVRALDGRVAPKGGA